MSISSLILINIIMDRQKLEPSITPSFDQYSQISEEGKYSLLSVNSKMQDQCKKQSSLHVAIRCRPLLKHEIKANYYEILRIMDRKVSKFIIISL